MSGGPRYYVTTSTTLLQLDTSIDENAIVFLSSLKKPGSLITIRDMTGRIHYDPTLPAASNNIITVSTTQGVNFLDGGGPSNNIYRITQPYGFITVVPKTSTLWGIVNTFGFPDGSTAANIQNLTASSITISNSYLTNAYIASASISTLQINSITTSTLTLATSFTSLATISTLSANTAYINDLQTSSIIASTATISNSYLTNAYIGSASISTMQINSITASSLTIATSFTSLASISTLYANTAYMNDLQTSSITASSLTLATSFTSLATLSTLSANTAYINVLLSPYIITSSIITENVSANYIITPIIYNRSLYTSSILTSTVTASKIGIGKAPSAYTLDVNGTANIETGLSISQSPLVDGVTTYNLSIPGATNQRMGNLSLTSIQTSGNVNIGTKANFATNLWNTSSDTVQRFYFKENSGTFFGSGDGIYRFQNILQTLDNFIIDNSGNVYARGAYGNISDSNLKENIIKARDYTNDLCKLNVVNFNFKDPSGNFIKTSCITKELGFIAQQVKEVFPSLVETAYATNEETSDVTSSLVLKTSVLTPMIVTAIQNFKPRIDFLESSLLTLQSTMNGLLLSRR